MPDVYITNKSTVFGLSKSQKHNFTKVTHHPSYIISGPINIVVIFFSEQWETFSNNKIWIYKCTACNMIYSKKMFEYCAFILL